MPDPTRSARHRLQLWLRSERAFGLSSVSAAHLAGPLPESELETAPEHPAAPAVPRAAPVLRQREADDTGAAAVAAPARLTAEPLLMPDPDAGAMNAPQLVPDEKRARLIALDENEVRG